MSLGSCYMLPLLFLDGSRHFSQEEEKKSSRQAHSIMAVVGSSQALAGMSINKCLPGGMNWLAVSGVSGRLQRFT